MKTILSLACGLALVGLVGGTEPDHRHKAKASAEAAFAFAHNNCGCNGACQGNGCTCAPQQQAAPKFVCQVCNGRGGLCTNCDGRGFTDGRDGSKVQLAPPPVKSQLLPQPPMVPAAPALVSGGACANGACGTTAATYFSGDAGGSCANGSCSSSSSGRRGLFSRRR